MNLKIEEKTKRICKSEFCLTFKVLKNKKAAMFGLDARIALAIFGALSVITGAALFSAIQNARIVAIKTDLDEMAKSFEAYWLDTGQLPGRNSTNTADAHYFYFNASELVEDPGVTGWNGPYLGYSKKSVATLNYSKFKEIDFKSVDKDGVLTAGNPWSTIKCVAGKSCTLVVGIGDNVDDVTFHALDGMVDGGDGALVGRIRGYGIGNALPDGYIYYTAGIPLPNPLPNP